MVSNEKSTHDLTTYFSNVKQKEQILSNNKKNPRFKLIEGMKPNLQVAFIPEKFDGSILKQVTQDLQVQETKYGTKQSRENRPQQ